MVFVDTGFFIALYDPKDSLHDRAMEWSIRIGETLLVTEYVLWEVVNHFSDPRDRPRAYAALDMIQQGTDVEYIPASQSSALAGINLHRQRTDKAWSLTDCISFEIMRDFDVMKALTHDHHFTQAGFDALLRRDPT